jgi:hypothetical protein
MGSSGTELEELRSTVSVVDSVSDLDIWRIFVLELPYQLAYRLRIGLALGFCR